MKSIYYIVIALFLISITYSCKRTAQCIEQSVAISQIQGEWKHIPNPADTTVLYFTSPKVYSFNFTEDSFYLRSTFHQDYGDTICGFEWIEYAKGLVIKNNGTIKFEGIYCNEDYTEKISGCFTIGKYTDSFNAFFCNDTLILQKPKNAFDNYSGLKIKLVR